MDKKNKYQTITIVALVAVLLVMSIGFAFSTINLNLNGNVHVDKASWDIKFDTTSFKETVGSVTATADPTINDTSVEYSVTLTKPGDFYEFTIDAKNFGTFDAILNSITMAGVSDDQKKFLKYSISYDNNEYLETTQLTNNANVLAPNGTENFKVRVEYILPESENDLPSSAIDLTLTATLLYAQKTA